MVVTGRADISVILQGNIEEINNMVIDFKKIKDIVTTETLIEVEVNLGW
jgi:6-pyruvoyl-tetrahydropterin synthase